MDSENVLEIANSFEKVKLSTSLTRFKEENTALKESLARANRESKEKDTKLMMYKKNLDSIQTSIKDKDKTIESLRFLNVTLKKSIETSDSQHGIEIDNINTNLAKTQDKADELELQCKTLFERVVDLTAVLDESQEHVKILETEKTRLLNLLETRTRTTPTPIPTPLAVEEPEEPVRHVTVGRIRRKDQIKKRR